MKPATIVMDLFMTVVSGKKLLPFILNNSALDVEGVLEPPVEKEIELHNCSAITGPKRFFIRFLPHLICTDIPENLVLRNFTKVSHFELT